MVGEKRNYALDFLKFVFAVIVMLFHSNSLTNDHGQMIFLNGRIGVEFFFLVSGCLMCESALRRAADRQADIGLETWNFIREKAMRLMPNFFVAYFVAFSVFHVNEGITELPILAKHMVQSLPDLLMIKNSGIRSVSYNGVTWYISAMMLSMIVIYPLMRKFGNTFFFVIAPTMFLLIMGAFFQNYGSLSDLENWNGYILKGTLRAFADILGGCICWKAAAGLRQYRFSALGKAMLTAAEWSAYIISIVFIYGHGPSRYDYAVFLLFMIGVTITFSRTSYDGVVFRHKIFGWLGTYSLSLYLGHSCWRKYTDHIFPQALGFHGKLALFLTASVFTSLFIMYISIFLREIWKSIKPAVEELLFEKS